MSASKTLEKLLISDIDPKQLPASQRIPAIARPFVSDKARKTLDILERFVEEDCVPADPVIGALTGSTLR